MGSRLRSPFLILLTGYLALVLFVWWIVEIVIHSLPQATPDNDFTLQITLAEQSLQLFMYTCLLTLFILGGCWYAELERTRAARSVSLCVSTLTKSLWLYELWFVISVYDNSSSPMNWYCTGGDQFNGLTDSSSYWCNTAQAVASLSIAMFVGYIALWIWCIYVLFKRIVPDVPIPTTHLLLPSHTTGATNASNSAHNMDISWQTLLTHPEDLEQHHIASAYPHLFGPTRTRLLFVGKLCQIPMFFVPIGVLLLTYPSIAFSHATGLDAWTTSAGATENTSTYTGWGDPIIAANWYWIVGILAVSMVINATANNRSNRSWSAAAAVMSALTAGVFWSFFIYSARRLHASYGNFVSTSLLNTDNAQYAEIAGAGVVMLSLTALSVLFVIRYFLYLRISPEQHRAIHTPAHLDGPTEVRVDRDDGTHTDHADGPTVHVPGPAYDANVADQVPSYNRSALSGVSIPMRFLLAVEAVVLFAWWVMMIVQESRSDVFTYSQADAAYFYNERMFILCVALGATAFGSAVYTERHLSRPTDLAAWAVSALTLAAFFILIWPFAFQSVYDGGDLYQAVCPIGTTLCNLTQATGVFAMIQGFLLFFIFTHTSLRVCTTWQVAPQVSAPGRMGRLSLSMLVMAFIVTLVWIWALVTIAVTVHSPGFSQQMQHVDGPGEGNVFVEGYFASQAFLLLTAVIVAVWLACACPGRTVEWQSPAWRGLTVSAFIILFMFSVPLLIEACRFARDLTLNGAEAAFVAVFIMMAAAALAALLVEVGLSLEPYATLREPPVVAMGQPVKPPLPPRPLGTNEMAVMVPVESTTTTQTVVVR